MINVNELKKLARIMELNQDILDIANKYVLTSLSNNDKYYTLRYLKREFENLEGLIEVGGGA